MNLITVLGIVGIIAGLAVMIWPVLLNIIVGLVLILMGAMAVYVGSTGRRLA